MRYRLSFLLLLPFAAGLTGCAAMKPGEGGPTFGPQAWNQAPAPPQKTVANTVPSAFPEPDDPSGKPVGLAKYFPGLQRTQAEPPKLAARYRPTWFGLRPNPDAVKPAQPTTYMTDARPWLNKPALDTATLPVSLEVPVPIPAPKPATDHAVAPTSAEQPMSPSVSNTNPATWPTENTSTPVLASNAIPDFGGRPSKPGEDEVNPLPPAIEPGSQPTAAVSRMPEVPPVDPQGPSQPANPVTAQPIAVSPVPASATLAPSDLNALKAITPVTNSSVTPGLPEATVPASYASSLIASEAVGFHKSSAGKVLASPQSTVKPTSQAAPSPQSPPKPRPQIKPTGQSLPVPTSLSKPSPQATTTTASPQSGGTPAATTWQRPCLRRLVRKVCHLGEYADPPTAAPH